MSGFRCYMQLPPSPPRLPPTDAPPRTNPTATSDGELGRICILEPSPWHDSRQTTVHVNDYLAEGSRQRPSDRSHAAQLTKKGAFLGLRTHMRAFSPRWKGCEDDRARRPPPGGWAGEHHGRQGARVEGCPPERGRPPRERRLLAQPPGPCTVIHPISSGCRKCAGFSSRNAAARRSARPSHREYSRSSP